MVAGLGGDNVTNYVETSGDGGTSVVETGFDAEYGWFLHNLVLYLVVILVYGILLARISCQVKTKSFVERCRGTHLVSFLLDCSYLRCVKSQHQYANIYLYVRLYFL